MHGPNIITLYKNKGDHKDCNNYRGIPVSFLTIVVKTFAIVPVILTRLPKHSLTGHRFCLFVCLGIFVPHENKFHSYGVVTITGDGLQILTYARQIWPLSSEGSLACHTYCDTGHPFLMVISEYPWHSHLLPSVSQWTCNYLYLWFRSVAAGIRTPSLPLAGPTL